MYSLSIVQLWKKDFVGQKDSFVHALILLTSFLEGWKSIETLVGTNSVLLDPVMSPLSPVAWNTEKRSVCLCWWPGFFTKNFSAKKISTKIKIVCSTITPRGMYAVYWSEKKRPQHIFPYPHLSELLRYSKGSLLVH